MYASRPVVAAKDVATVKRTSHMSVVLRTGVLAALSVALLASVGGCPQGGFDGFGIAPFTTSDLAGTWDIEMEGFNPTTGQRESVPAGRVHVVIDREGNITEAVGATDWAIAMFEQVRLEFSDTTSGAVRALAAVPLLGEIEVGTGSMTASRRQIELYYSINDGTIRGTKR
jgi:hypothetical protein